MVFFGFLLGIVFSDVFGGLGVMVGNDGMVMVVVFGCGVVILVF